MSGSWFNRIPWVNPKGKSVHFVLPFRCLALAHHSCTFCFSMANEVIPAPYIITANDKRGLIVVTGAAVLAFVWSCFLIRVWLRLQSREWRSDGEFSMSHHM
jgi:hypothetical protein